MATTAPHRSPIRHLAVRFSCALAFALCVATPAFAITAGDVLDKMSADERSGYFGGAIEMAMHIAATEQKNGAKADCIFEWFYLSDGKAARELMNVFRANKARPASGLIAIVIARHCK
jgi:hypothetical protein